MSYRVVASELETFLAEQRRAEHEEKRAELQMKRPGLVLRAPAGPSTNPRLPASQPIRIVGRRLTRRQGSQ